jgi:hypothetical protein
MMDLTISEKAIKRGQIGALVTFILLILFNIIFLVITKTTNALILTFITVFFICSF